MSDITGLLSPGGQLPLIGPDHRPVIQGGNKLGRAQAAAPTFVEVTEQLVTAAEPDAGELELVVGRTLLRVRGRVEVEALTRVLDVLEARA